jgi:hypothetical protein
MLIGLGDLGGVILQLLALQEGIERIFVGSRNTMRSEARCNLARLGAITQGYSPDIEFVSLDLNHVEETAENISRISPSIVISTASMMTWWFPRLFPEEQKAQLDRIGFGAWLPVHLDLAMKLMQVLKFIGYQGHSLIASYPDVVCPVLKARGLAPSAGFGNLDEVVPKIRLLAGRKLGVHPRELQVWFVAHHALEKWIFNDHGGKPPPCYLKMALKMPWSLCFQPHLSSMYITS